MKRREAATKKKEDKIQEMHDIETMQVDTLESLLVRVNEDHVQLNQQSHKIIKELRYDVAVKNSKVREYEDNSKNQKEQINRLEASILWY